ncbi:MAG: AraC-like DNA-binding protein [Oceanospirillaceae bacterium]|jgi:AraC-like DNA-binding protein
MEHLDRLTSLFDHFHLRVRPVLLEKANLVVLRGSKTTQSTLIFWPRSIGVDTHGNESLVNLYVDFGSKSNPLSMALPEQVTEIITADSEMANLVSLLCSEQSGERCGSPVVLSRLGEVLVVRILRLQLGRGVTTPGILGGLANPSISKALVAIHESPGNMWKNTSLADIAGLSHSRFKQLFAELVGDTPGNYLRRWRLTLAQIDLKKGDRVDSVAYRYGYQAADAFSRAFQKEFGVRPKASVAKKVVLKSVNTL